MMSDDAKCAAPTPAATLEQHITDSHFPKNEAEWWAHYEIIRLREENARLRNCIRFFASVIKSGEEWSETCQQKYAPLFRREKS